MFKKITFYMLLLSFIVLTGCTLLFPTHSPMPAKYLLNISPEMQKTSAPLNQTLLVSNTQTVDLYSTTEMIYTLLPLNKTNSFAKHAWTLPPATMLTDLLVQALRKANVFRVVAVKPFSGLVNKQLSTQLLCFQQEFFANHSQSVFHIILAAQLINSQSQQVIANRQWDIKVPVQAQTPEAGVIAANLATEKLLIEIVNFVRLGSVDISPTAYVPRLVPVRSPLNLVI